jgi:hypothetical protein
MKKQIQFIVLIQVEETFMIKLSQKSYILDMLEQKMKLGNNTNLDLTNILYIILCQINLLAIEVLLNHLL